MGNGNSTFGLQFSDAEDDYSLHVGLICDPSVSEYTTTELIGTDGKNFTTTVTSTKACPTYTPNALWLFIQDYNWIWCVLFVGIGAILCFMGRMLFKITIFLVTAMFTIFGILLLFYGTFLYQTTEAWVGWTILICSILIGLVVGLFTMKMEREGSSLVAAWGGFLLGMTLNETVLYLA